MPNCATCRIVLSGTWNFTRSVWSDKGRYVGIKDGFFLGGEEANWVNCYCYECWKEEVLKLSFVRKLASAPLQTIPEHVELCKKYTRLGQQHKELMQQMAEVKKREESLSQLLNQTEANFKAERAQLSQLLNQTEANFKAERAQLSQVHASTLPKLQEMLKLLAPSQILLLEAHTNFRVNTFQEEYNTYQLKTSEDYVKGQFHNLKVCAETVRDHQEKELLKIETSMTEVVEALSKAGLPDSVMNDTKSPIQKQIDEKKEVVIVWQTYCSKLSSTLSSLWPSTK